MEERGRVKKLGSRFSAVASLVRRSLGQLNFHFVCALCRGCMQERRAKGKEGDENWQRMTLH